jgi:hypothetical protein
MRDTRCAKGLGKLDVETESGSTDDADVNYRTAGSAPLGGEMHGAGA